MGLMMLPLFILFLLFFFGTIGIILYAFSTERQRALMRQDLQRFLDNLQFWRK